MKTVSFRLNTVLAAVAGVELQPGVPVAELPAARQLDEQVAVDIAEGQAVLQPDGAVLLDGCPRCQLAGPSIIY